MANDRDDNRELLIDLMGMDNEADSEKPQPVVVFVFLFLIDPPSVGLYHRFVALEGPLVPLSSDEDNTPDQMKR